MVENDETIVSDPEKTNSVTVADVRRESEEGLPTFDEIAKGVKDLIKKDKGEKVEKEPEDKADESEAEDVDDTGKDDPAPEVSENDEPEDEPDEQIPDFPQELISRARAIGLPDGVVEAFNSPEQLDSFLKTLVMPAGQHKDTGKDEKQEQDVDAISDKQLAEELGLSEEYDLEDPAIKILLNQERRIRKQSTPQKPDVDPAVTAVLEAEENRFDGYVNTLEKEWEDTLGKEPGVGKPTDKDKWTNRKKLYDRFVWLKDSYGNSGPLESRIFQEALMLEFDKVVETKSQKKVTDKLRKREAQITVPPTHRESSKEMLSPEEREEHVLKNLGKRMREKGMLESY